MKSLHKFFRLKGADRRLFIKAFFLLIVVRLALTFTSYKTIEKRLAAPAAKSNGVGAGRIAWVVRNTAPLVPGASCLTQALVAQHLMAKAGKTATIRIGVAKEENGKIAAHAWLLWENKVVIGDAAYDLSRFTSIADLSPGSS